MSFTQELKTELSKIKLDKLELISELSAFFRNSAIIDTNIKVTTENASTARMIFNGIKRLYNIVPSITLRHGYNYNKNYLYILNITDSDKRIMTDLSLNHNIPEDYIIDDDNLVRSYLRGIFLASGSVNDPKKSRYHLEISVDNKEYAEYVKKLMNKFDLNAKTLSRDNRCIIYLKEAEKIGDFLRIVNSVNSLFYYEDIRIYRDHKNMTNRLNNCEQANVDKIINTASKQVKEIEKIKKLASLDLLDDKTKEVAEYRLKYKDASLVELSEIITLETGNRITKSGLYHRFKKIEQIASRIK